MAKAVQSVVTKMVEVSETGYTLELSAEEALTLKIILQHVGGSPTHSRRKHADAIDAALRSAGVPSGESHPSVPTVPSGIIFKNGV